MSDLTISQAISAYLDNVQLARSQNTARTYKNALSVFERVLEERWLDPETSPATKLSEDAITWLATYLKNFSAPTERLYLTAVSGFYEYVAAERLAEVNLPRLEAILSRNEPHLTAYDTDRWAEERAYIQQDGQTVLQEFSQARTKLVETLTALEPEAWSRAARHALIGPTTLAELMKIAAEHDWLHMAQLCETLNALSSHPPH